MDRYFHLSGVSISHRGLAYYELSFTKIDADDVGECARFQREDLKCISGGYSKQLPVFQFWRRHADNRYKEES